MKQVIVMIKFKSLRTGKYCAQAAHASVQAALKSSSSKMNSWLAVGMPKIVLQVETETELLDLMEKAQAKKLTVALITDSGYTEFHGTPTITCLGIGPAQGELIDSVTGHLKLL